MIELFTMREILRLYLGKSDNWSIRHLSIFKF